MSTPNPDPFATPDAQQIARNEAERLQREQQAAEQRAAYARQQQQDYAQYQAAQRAAQYGAPGAGGPGPGEPGAGGPGAGAGGPAQQQWASQQWQGQNPYAQGPYGPYSPHPGMPPQYQANAESKSVGTAMGALILGIISLFIAPIGLVAVVLGMLALRTIKRTGAQGKGMAVTGTILGALTTVATIIGAVLMVMVFQAATPASLNVAKPTTVPTNKAQVGHCIDVIPQSSPNLKYTLVSCDEPHAAELFETQRAYREPDGHPDTSVIRNCIARTSDLRDRIEELGDENIELFAVTPVLQDVSPFADEYVHCFVKPAEGKFVGSFWNDDLEIVN